MKDPQPAPDDELLTLTRLWMEAQPRVLAFLGTVIPSFHDAQDLLQQTALEAARSFGSYDRERPFTPWVITIARRCVAGFFEQNRKRRERCVYTDVALDALAEYHGQPGLESQGRQLALAKCREHLDDKAARILKLRYEEERSSMEMAELMGMTSRSIRVALTRIRRQLADCVRRKLVGEGAT